MTVTGYEPLNTLKPVAKGLWIVDGAPVTRAFVPVPTRSVIVALQSGGLWVYVGTPLTADLNAELAERGPVEHIVVPTQDYAHLIPDWSANHPQAQVWDTDALRVDEAQDEWRGQLHQRIVQTGAQRREAVFCHRPSRTLLFADLFEALETRFLPPWARPIVWFSGTDDTAGHMRPIHRWGRKYDDKVALGRDIEAVISWGPRAIIVGHGRNFERHAVTELERAFRKELRPLRWETAFQKTPEG